MNLTSLSKDQFNVRCPECQKLYAVQTNQVLEAQPKFRCASCTTHFSVPVAQALEADVFVGLPVYTDTTIVENVPAQPGPPAKTALRQLQTEVFSCPKCFAGYAPGDSECTRCGLVFLKFREQKEEERGFSASPEVRELWEVALTRYENFELHQNFINAAWADRSLEYAANNYRRILDVAPHDEMAQKAQRQIVALVNTRFEVVTKAVNEKDRKWLDNLDFFQGTVTTLRKIKFTSLIMVMCGALIVMGLMLPHMRNLIGFGTSILFFVLALRYYFRAI